MLVEIIRSVAEETQEARGAYRHRPSAIGQCIRKLTYHAQGRTPEPFPGRTILVFDDSSWHEELSANWIRHSGYTLHSEQMAVDVFKLDCLIKSGSPATITGHIDGIITDPLGVERLYEHKAINHFTWERMTKDPTLARDYFWQTALYLHGLRKIQPSITEALLLIKNKNTAQYQEYLLVMWTETSDVEVWTLEGTTKKDTVDVLENPVGQAFDKYTEIESCLADGTLPDRPYIYGDWHCDYCEYAAPCWEGYEKELGGEESGADLSRILSDAEKQEVLLYRETLDHITELNTLKKNLGNTIKNTLYSNAVQSGFLENIYVERKMRHNKARTTQASTTETLTIRYKKGEKADEKSN